MRSCCRTRRRWTVHLLPFVVLAGVLLVRSSPVGAQINEIYRTGTAARIGSMYRSLVHELRQDSFNWTPLMLAAAANPHPETIERLVSLGAEVGARSLDGWTPLMFAAAFNRNPAVAVALVTAGANLHARTPDSWSIHMGGSRFIGERVRFDNIGGVALAAVGPDQAGKTGWTAIFMAARYNEAPGLIDALVALGADPLDRDEYGRSPVYYAKRYNPNPLVAERLIALSTD